MVGQLCFKERNEWMYQTNTFASVLLSLAKILDHPANSLLITFICMTVQVTDLGCTVQYYGL